MYQPTNAPSMLFALEPRLLLSADIVALTIEAAIADSTPPPPPPPPTKINDLIQPAPSERSPTDLSRDPDAPPTLAVNGIARYGQTLQVDATRLIGPNGERVLAYRWQRLLPGESWSAIAGATEDSYTLTAADIGKQLRVEVTMTDAGGQVETLHSAATAEVETAPVVTGVFLRPTLDGTDGVGDIEVSVGFPERVRVTGTPTLTLMIGDEQKTAQYVSASDETTLVFRYGVMRGDAVPGGVGIVAMRLSLPEGASIRDRDGRDLVLGHVRVMADTGHKVDTSVRSSSEEVRSKRGRRSTATDNLAPVVDVNDIPKATDDTVKATPGKPRVIDPAELTENDQDADGDKLTVTAVDNAANGDVSMGSLLVQKEVKGTPGQYLQSYNGQKLPEGMVVQGMEIHYAVTLPQNNGLDESSTKYTFRFEKKQGNVKFLGRQGDATNHFRADWYGENVIIIRAEDSDGKVIMVKDKVFVHFATRRIMGGDAEGLTEGQRNNAFRDEIHDIGNPQRGMAFLPRDHSKGDPDSEEMKRGFYFVKEPRLFTTSKGTLLATHHIGRRSGSTEVRGSTDSHIGQGIAVSRSRDHGHSWDGKILVQQNRNHWGYTAMVELEEVHDGKKVDVIYMYVSAGSAKQAEQPWANVDYRGIYYFKSIDDGATWEGPTEHVGLNKVVLKGRKPVTRDGITYGNVSRGLAPTTNILKVPGLVLDGQTAPEGQGLLMHTYSWGYLHASIDGGTTWKKVADHDACPGVIMLNEVAWAVLDNDNQDIYMLFRNSNGSYKREYVLTREMTSATGSGKHCGLTFRANRAQHDTSLRNVPANESHHWLTVVPQGPDKGTLLYSNPGSRIAYQRYHAWLWVSREPITGEKTITKNLFQTPARVKHDVGWGQSAVEYLKADLSNTRGMGKDAIVLVGESEPIHKDTHQIIDLKPNTYTAERFSDERFTATTFVLSWEYLELLLNPVAGAGSSVTPPAVLYTGIVFTPDRSGQPGSFEYTVSDGTARDQGTVTVELNQAPGGSVTLPGKMQQPGDKLVADISGITDGDGLTKASFHYQWQHSTDGGTTWDDIIGETFGDYTVVSADTGKKLRVLVRYRDDLGTAETVESTVATVNSLATGTVTATGTTRQGQVLTATLNNIADANGVPQDVEYRYQWQRRVDDVSSWVPVSGAGSASYRLVQADVGQQMRVVVSFTDALGNKERVTSDATTSVLNVNDAPQAIADKVVTKPGQLRVMDPAELTENDKDPDGDDLTVTAVDNPVNGDVSIGSLLVRKEVKAISFRYLQSYAKQELPEGMVVQGMEIHYAVTLPQNSGLDEASTQYTFRFEKKQGNVKFLGTQGGATNHFRADWYGENVIIIQAKDKNNKVIMVKDKVFVHFASRRVLGGDAEGLTDAQKRNMYADGIHDRRNEHPGMTYLPRDHSKGDADSPEMIQGFSLVKEPRMLVTSQGTIIVTHHIAKDDRDSKIHKGVSYREGTSDVKTGTGIAVSRSDDHGNTWDSAILVQDGMEFWGYVSMVEVEKELGGVTIPVIHMYLSAGHATNNNEAGVNLRNRGIYRVESTDDGKTWSEPVRHPDLFDVIFASHENVDGNSANIPNGASPTTNILKVPGLVLDGVTAPEGQGLLMHTYIYGYLFASIDGGETWKKVAKYDSSVSAASFYNGAMESEIAWAVLNNDDQDIYMIVRQQSFGDSKLKYVISRNMRAGDKGVTLVHEHGQRLGNLQVREAHHWMIMVPEGPGADRLLFSGPVSQQGESVGLWVSSPLESSDTVTGDMFALAPAMKRLAWGQSAVEYLRSGLPGTRGMGRDAIVLVGESEPVHKETHQIIDLKPNGKGKDERFANSMLIFSWEYLEELLKPPPTLGFEASEGWTGYADRLNSDVRGITDNDGNVWSNNGAKILKHPANARTGEHSLDLSSGVVTLDPAGSNGVVEVSFYIKRTSGDTRYNINLRVEYRVGSDGSWTQAFNQNYQDSSIPSTYTKVTVPINQPGDVQLKISVMGVKGFLLDDFSYTDYGGSAAATTSAVPYTGIVFTPDTSGSAGSFEYTVSDGTLTNKGRVTVGLNNVPGGSVALPGSTQVGDKLIADTSGITDGDGLTRAVFRYQWQRSTGGGSTWEDILGEIFDDYTVVSADTGKKLRVLVRYRDDQGTAETVESTVVTVVTSATAPTVTGTAITSSGPYKEDAVIEVTVTYNEAVVVDTTGGIPFLTLVVDSTGRQATYARGSSSNRLVFQYRVQAGDTDTDGVSVREDSLVLNSGTIQDGAGNAALLAHDAVTAASDQAVDTTAPDALRVTWPTDTGRSSSDGITKENRVTITGQEAGASWEYSVNSGTDWTTGSSRSFTLSDGVYAIDAIRVRQRDEADNTSPVSKNAKQITVDATAPSVTNTEITSTGPYKEGDVIDVTVTYGEKVKVTGRPYLTLVVGTANRQAVYQSGSDSTELVFRYTVVANETDGDGVVVMVNSLNLNSGTIGDVAGNAAALEHSAVTANSSHAVDTTAPSVTRTAITSSGPYKEGAVIKVTVTYGEKVKVTGTPYLTLVVGSTNRRAEYHMGTGKNKLVFQYRVQAGETDTDGVSVREDSLVLNSGTIQDLAGNTALLAHDAVTAASDQALDMTAPDALTVTWPTDTGSSRSDGITKENTVTIGAPEAGASWEYSVDGGNSWMTGSSTSFTLSDGVYAINAIQVRQRDEADNPSPVSKNAAEITVDAIAPVLVMDASRREVNAAKLREGVPFATGAVRVTDNVVLQGPVAVAAAVNGSDFMLGGSERGITTVVIDGSTYALVPANTDSGVQIIDISDPSDPRAVVALEDGKGGFDRLDGATDITTVVIDGSTYALVAPSVDNGVQIIDISNPSDPKAVAALEDGTYSITTVVIGGSTYALVVASSVDNGAQIIDISDPSDPQAVAALEDGKGGFDRLKGAVDITTVVIGGRTYALVAASSDDGVQIIDISNPSSPQPVAALEDDEDGFTKLEGASSITTVVIGDSTYALVASYDDDGVQIIDISTPSSPKPVAAIGDNADGFTELKGAVDLTTVVIGGRTYALVAAYVDNGVQIIDISDPSAPQAVTALEDGKGRFDSLGGANGVTTVTVDGRVYALVAAYGDNAVQLIGLPVSASIASIKINTEGLETTHEQLRYGAGETDFLAIGGQTDSEKTRIAIAGIDGLELTWSASDNSITIRKADNSALTTIEAEAIIAALRYTHGDADNAGEGERVFTFVLRDTAGNDTASARQVGVSVEVDATAPSVTRTVITSRGPYKEGDAINVTVTYNEDVVVDETDGTPYLMLVVGNTDRRAEYKLGTGSTDLVFRYTVVASETDANGVVVTANSLNLNSGTIQDLAGNDASLRHLAVSAADDQKVDTTAPGVLTVTWPKDTGSNSSDGITNANRVTIAGQEARASWEYSVDGGVKWTDGGSGTGFTLLEGSYVKDAIRVRQRDEADNTSVVSKNAKQITVDTTAPSVTRTAITSSGPYLVGDVIEVTVTYNEAVVVNETNGKPSLTLVVDAVERKALYADGTGKNKLVFRYRVKSGETDLDGVVVKANSLTLSNGTIRDLAGNAAALGNSAVTAASSHAVDATPPTVSDIAITSTGPYKAGAVIEVTVTYSEAVVVDVKDGTPFLTLVVGTTERQALYADGTGKNKLVFRYTVKSGETDTDGVVVKVNSLTLSNGTIEDGVGYTAVPGHSAVAAVSSHAVDTTPPTVPDIAITSTGPYKVGDVIKVTVTYNEAVVVDVRDGTPFLTLVVGSTERKALYADGTASNKLVFQYTVRSGETDPDGVVVKASSLTLSNGTIGDLAGNTASLNNAVVTAVSSHAVDAAPPVVTDTKITSSGPYLVGDVIEVTVTYNEAVVVDTKDGTPFLMLVVGATDRQALYADGTSSNKLVFRYRVQSGETDPDGVVVKANSLTLSNGTIQDGVGYTAMPGHSGVLADISHAVDATPPLVTDTKITSSGPYLVGDVIEVTVTYNDAVVVDDTEGTPFLTLVVGATERQALYADGTASNKLVFRYRFEAGETDEDGVSVRANSLALNGGMLKDREGNAASLKNAEVPAASSQAVDATPPVVTSTEVTSDGPYREGAVIEVTVTYNEAVVVDTNDGTPSLTLVVGKTYRQAVYQSVTGNNKLVFRYRFEAGETDEDGVSVQANSLALNGAMLKDPEGNAALLTHTAVDAIAPVLVMDASRRKVNAAKLGEGVPLATGAVRVTDDVALQAPVLTVSVTDEDGFGLEQSYNGVTTVVIDGSTYALVPSGSQGLQIIDISDPSGPQATKLIAGGNGFTALDSPRSVATAVIDGKTYALVASYADDDGGVQIIDISNPSSPQAIAAIKDGAQVGGTRFTTLAGAWGITTVVIDGKTYALVAAVTDGDGGGGVQIIDVSDPSTPKAVAALEDGGVGGFTELSGAIDITTVVIGGKTYALVAAFLDGGVQIIDISDPSDPRAVAALDDGADGFDRLNGAIGVTAVTVEGRVYALVAAFVDGGVQIIDISNPSAPQAVAALEDGVGGFTGLSGAFGITTAVVGGRTYALVTARGGDNGVQIIDISDPSAPQAVTALEDGKGGFDNLGGAIGVTTVTVEGRVYALVTAFNDNAVQIIELSVSASIASIEINTEGLEATDEQLRYGAGSNDVLEIGGQAATEKTGVAIAGIDGLKLAWSATDNSITIRKADNNALTTVQTEAIIAALRYAHGDADNAGDGERFFTFVLRDTAGNVTALNQQVGVSVEVDKTPPAAPTLDLNEDTGASSSDGVTSNGAFTVGGVEVGASWEYSTDSGTNWKAGTGTSFTLSDRVYETNAIQVRQRDAADNPSAVIGNTKEITVDTLAPSSLTMNLPTDTGKSSSDGITKENTVTIAGKESGASWEYSTDSGRSWKNGSVSSFTLPDGTYTKDMIHVRQTDAAGNTSTVSKNPTGVTVDTSAPSVTNTAITSSGPYKAGAAIDVTVTYKEAVEVDTKSGTPYLTLVVGSTNQRAAYHSGKGSTDLVFRYTVQSGETDANGVVVTANSLTLNGGKISDVAGNAASRTNLAVIAANAQKVDTTAPASLTVSWPTDTGSSNKDGITKLNTVTISTPESGASWEYSTDSGQKWKAGSVTSFTLPDGVYRIDAIRVRQRDAADNPSAVIKNANQITVDTRTPSALTMRLPTDTGSSSSDGITKENTVTIAGKESGASWEYSTDSGRSWKNGSSTSFTLPDGTYTKDMIHVRQTDAAGNTSTVSKNPTGRTVDTSAPSVTNTAITSSGPYKAGAAIDVTVTYNEAVEVDTKSGTPYLTLVVGSTNQRAAYHSGKGSTDLVFRYTVQSGETDANGVVVTANSLTLNGGKISDVAGNAASRTNLAVIAANAQKVDTTAPASLTVSWPTDTGSSNKDGITNANRVTISTPESGASWEYSLNGGKDWRTGSSTSFTLPDDVYAIDAIQVRQRDEAGNTSSVSGNTEEITVDTTAPTVTAEKAVMVFAGHTVDTNGEPVGRELLVTDGDGTAPRLLKDIYPGARSSAPTDFYKLKDGRVLFVANDGVHGRELWWTDGTAKGTQRLGDINTGSDLAALHVGIVNGQSGDRLRHTPATDGGRIQSRWDATGQVLTLYGGGSVAEYMAALGEVTFQRGSGSDHGLGNDETLSLVVAAGPDLPVHFDAQQRPRFLDIVGNQRISATRARDEVFWSDRYGLDARLAPVLTAHELELAKVLMDGRGIANPWIGLEKVGNQWLLDWNGDRQGRYAANTLLAGIARGGDLSDENGPYGVLRKVSSSSYEIYGDVEHAGSKALYSSTFSDAPYGYLVEYTPKPGEAYGTLLEFTVDSQGGITFTEQVLTMGAPAPGTESTPSAAQLGSDSRLQVSSGGEDKLLLRPADRQPFRGTGDSLATRFIEFTDSDSKDWVLFAANDGVHGVELWRLDPATGELTLLKDINTDKGQSWNSLGSAYPEGFVVFGDQVLFTALDGTHGRELWITDGTSDGTQLLSDIRTGNRSLKGSTLPRDSEPLGLTVFESTAGPRAVFAAAGNSGGQQLWLTDGTSAGTRLLKTIRSGGDAGLDSFVVVKGTTTDKVFFVAYDGGTSGRELWVTDGTTVGTQVIDVLPGRGSSHPAHLTVYGQHVFFTATGPGTQGRELWVSDGTTSGTVQVTNIDTRTDSGSRRLSQGPRDLFVFGDTLLFAAEDNSKGYEPYALDLSPLKNGTVAQFAGSARPVLLGNLRADAGKGSFPKLFTRLGEKVLFTADDGVVGRELWETDGTKANTKRVADSNPGLAGSSPTGLQVVTATTVKAAPGSDDTLVVVGAETAIVVVSDGLERARSLLLRLRPMKSPKTGMELFITGNDGQVSLLKDIRLGRDGSYPGSLVPLVNGHVLFVADDGWRGRELWLTDGDAGWYQTMEGRVSGGALVRSVPAAGAG